MRLLILELCHSAGTRTVLRQIVPRFAERCDAVLYCGHNTTFWRTAGLEASSFGALYAGFQTWRDRLSRRVGTREVKECVFWSVLDRFIEKKQVTHVFLPWVIGQSIPRLRVPTGAMVMDLLWRHFPEEFPGDASMEKIFLENQRQADLVFPVSESTAHEMAAHFDLRGIQLLPVPHGAQPPHAEALEPRSDEPGDPYFLYPAQTTENKNHATLFEAMRLLADKGVRAKVVCTSRSIDRLREGSAGSNHEGKLRSWLEAHPDLLKTNIDLRGEVEWTDLEQLYRGCRAVVLPSLYEGFGLPLLEAFERNVPVICSGIAPFVEQIERYCMDDRTTVVDPLTPEHLADVLQSALGRPDQTPLISGELADRLAKWTWDDAVDLYLSKFSQINHANRLRK